jgi:2-methylcitrate dehydratase
MSEKSKMSGPTALDRLAHWSLAPEPAYRQPLALTQAKLLVLDSIGCAFAAHATGAVEGVVEAVREWGGAPEATIIGVPGKTSVLNAVLANGGLVRVLDLNDIMFAEKEGALAVAGHRSDNIVVALAIGEKFGLPGEALLESIVMNYELYGRLRQLMPEDSPWDGSCVSGLVAAAMAGRLMGLDEERQANGLGLAAARTAVPQIVRKGEMSAGKSLANALVAQSGVMGALLAAKGVTGPREALEHNDGLHQVFDPERDLTRLWAKPAQPLEILSAHMKSYPSIGTSQTMVTAALDLRAKLAGRLGAVERIDVTMADVPAIRKQQADRKRSDPRTREAADHSFTFLPCVTLVDGELTTRQFDNDRWLEPEVRGLMEKVVLGVDADLRDRAPGSMPCRLTVRLKGGETLSSECLYPPGHSFADKGLNAEAVIAKFHAVARDKVGDKARQKIVEEVMAMDKAPSVAKLMQSVSGEAIAR